MAKKKKVKRPGVEKRGVLDARVKETMLAVICRNPVVLEQVYDMLPVEDVRVIDDGYSLVYRAVCDFYKKYSLMPEKAQLLDSVNQLIQDHPAQLSPMEVGSVESFIDLAYDAKEWGKKDLASDETYATVALKAFRDYRDELTALRLAEAIGSGRHVPVDLAGVLRGSLTEVDQHAILEARPVPKLFGDGWMKKNLEKPVSTGLPFFDVFLGGGYRKREVVLFMGPYGSCKTTVAVMGLCEGARIAQLMTEAAQQAGEGVHYVAVLASYEMPRSELHERCLAYLARIPRKRQAKISDLETQLRCGGELLEYEKKLYKRAISKGAVVPSERQRVDGAVALLNEHALFLDMTSTDPENPTQGCGGPRELATYLRAESKRSKKIKLLFESVWVDHAAAMVCNAMGTDEFDFSNDTTRRLIKYIPKQLGDWVAKAFECPVMLLHQLSGEANSRIPTADFHHTDSDECKSIGMFCDFCIQTGPQTQDGRQLCVFDCTKHRRQPPRQRQIVRVRGQFNEVVLVSDKYTVDGPARRIVTVEEYQSLTGEKPKKTKKPKKVTLSDIGAGLDT